MATSKLERQLNLIICLMSARTYVTAKFLRKNVVGYSDGGQTDDSFKRMLERDKADLRAMGIPLETGHTHLAAEEGYRIKPEDYTLTGIALEPDEAAVVAAAAAFWHDPDVAVESQTALLKLKAAGIDAAAPAEIGFGPLAGGRSVGDERVLRTLIDAVVHRQAVGFDYRFSPGKEMARELEPWGVRTHSGHWYVTGFDRGRAGVRTFRISRLANARAVGRPDAVVVPDDADVSALVDAAVRRSQSEPELTARVWVAQGRGNELRRMATSLTDRELGGEPGQEAVIVINSRTGLIRAVLGAGGDAAVLDPPDLRESVIAELDALLASATGSGDQR